MASRLKKGSAIAAAAIALVGAWEGLRTAAYIPIKGDVPTVCYGWTIGVKLGDRYTVEECQAMLGDGLREFEQGIRKCMTDPDKVPDSVYVASISLAYNIGQSAFCRSTVVKRINAGRWREACDAFLAWNRAGGKVIKGLVNRRKAERSYCLQDVI